MKIFKPLRLTAVVVATSLLVACGTSVSIKSQSVFGPSKNVPGILSKPDGKGLFPVIVLLHGSGGMLDHETNYWSQFLNGLDYVALTPNTGVRGRARPDWEVSEKTAEQALDVEFEIS